MTYEVVLSSRITSRWKINHETIFCKEDLTWYDSAPLISDVYPEVIEVTRLIRNVFTSDFIFKFKNEEAYPHITAWSEYVYDVHVNGSSVNGFYIKGEEAKITWFLLSI